MPIDPSIIGNIMAPQAVQLPDVNAMMRTQTRGMENIYQIEAARGAQAKEDAKAQEDAAVKALLPAYAHALKTGDMRGALSLAPPEYQDGLLPYVEALDGKPLEEIQAALTGSLVTSEVGRAFLENQSRVATLGVQQGQLEVSRGNLAIDKTKLAQGPEGRYSTVKGGDGKMYIINNSTGEMRLAKADDGTAITSESAAVEGLDPKTKAKFDQALPKAKASLRTTFSAYANDIADVQALLADDAGIAAITGAFNAYTPDITKDATRAAGLLNKIRAGNMFSALQELRTSSPTGAAVGNVSNEEGRNLRDSVAALDRAQSADDFKRALAKLAVDLEVARRNVAAAFDDTYGYRNDVTSTDMETEARAIREAAEREVGKTTPLPTQQPSGYRIINQRPQR
jgi:hypothetical protein